MAVPQSQATGAVGGGGGVYSGSSGGGGGGGGTSSSRATFGSAPGPLPV